MRRRVALTVAGSDSGGGAGVAADLKTFEAHDVWGTVAVTAVTAQNTLGVQAWEPVPAALLRAQIASVASDIRPDAAKTAMLGTAELVVAATAALRDSDITLLVVDPVLASGHGDRLLGDHLLRGDALDALRSELLPLATVLTPNLAEASALLGGEVAGRAAMEEAAAALVGLGARTALVTGGHLDDEAGSPDCLAVAGMRPVWLEGVRQPGLHTHGGGCVLSAAICAELARGMEPADACVAGKRFVERAIAAGFALGAGPGPVDPGWRACLEPRTG